jgi:nitrile hydratase subunit beta
VNSPSVFASGQLSQTAPVGVLVPFAVAFDDDLCVACSVGGPCHPCRDACEDVEAAAIQRLDLVQPRFAASDHTYLTWRYDRCVERAVHDRGGWPNESPIDRTDHELADWELLTDALAGALGNVGVMNVDELRRAIESMPPESYETASYYERWLFAMETILTEKGVLAPGEIDARLAA